MSIEYSVSHNGLRIETFPNGVLDMKDTIDYFARLKNDKNIKQGAIEVVYFRYVTDFKISFLESERITKNYQDPKDSQMIAATIFVCETDLAYGIGRMLQTFHEITNPRHKVILARSDNELENIFKLA
jgi:hypothetical protein